ncbi:sensor histidine kinase [Uliginosibacterium sediminicola]|uniref:histidine kinase n=1 Tax=Uliginosibacterium sediminicola TaxID=2024550 RepID=A0ABU9YZB5_9RHOO
MRSFIERWAHSLSGRLLATYIGAWLVAAVLFGSLGSWLLRSDGRMLDHSAERAAHALTDYVRFDTTGRPSMAELPIKVQWLFIASPLDAGYRIFDASGQTLLWSSEATRQAWQNTALLQQAPSEHSAINVNGVAIHTASQRLTSPNGQTLWLQVALSERLAALRHDEMGNTFEFTIVLAALVSILLLGLVMWRVLLRVLAPIQRVSREAQAIEPQGPWQRLGTQGLPGEIAPLVRSFNQALDRLEEGFERQQRFLADAAHELKTPLALLRAHVELGSEDRAALLQDIDQMSRQVQQLLMLAEVSEPRSYQHEDIALIAVIQDVLSFLAPLAAQHAVLLQYHSHPDAAHSLQGDRSALFVLLKNLVENAIHVAPPGSAVSVALEQRAISVRDHGPGIAPAHLPRLFERFWRVPGSREGGAGLGLSICHEVAAAHGWQLTVRNASPGAEFKLAFAAAVPEAPTAPQADSNASMR